MVFWVFPMREGAEMGRPLSGLWRGLRAMADRHAEAAQELLRRILRREGEVVSSPGMAEDLAAHGVPLPYRRP